MSCDGRFRSSRSAMSQAPMPSPRHVSDRVRKRIFTIVDQLPKAIDPIERLPKELVPLGGRKARMRRPKHRPGRAMQPRVGLAEDLSGRPPVVNDHLRRFGGRMRVIVGHQVGNRRVHLVPDPGDDRQPRRRDRPRNRLGVEAPEVFRRAPAAAEQDHVRPTCRPQLLKRLIEMPQGGGDGRAGRLALDRDGVERNRDERETPQNLEHVLQRGGRSAGDQQHPPRVRRQSALAVRGEQPFPLQLLLQLPEGQFQHPCPMG